MSEKQNIEEDSMLLTHHIFNNKKKEMSVMKHFRYRFPSNEPTFVESNTQVSEKDGMTKERHKTATNKFQVPQITQTSQFYRIDNKASVVNGKLVYIDTEEQSIAKDRHELMRLLKQNGISYKQYMLGNKEKIHRQIAEHKRQKEAKLLKEYVDKHINTEKTTTIQYTDMMKPKHRVL